MSKSELMNEESINLDSIKREAMRRLTRKSRKRTTDRYKQHRRNSKGGLHSQEKNAA